MVAIRKNFFFIRNNFFFLLKENYILCWQPSEPRKCRQFYVFNHPTHKSADSSMFSAIRTQKVPTVLCFQPSEPKKCRQLYVFSHSNPKSAHSCMFSIIRTQKVQTVVCFQSSEHRKGRQLYVCSSPLSFRNGKEKNFRMSTPRHACGMVLWRSEKQFSLPLRKERGELQTYNCRPFLCSGD